MSTVQTFPAPDVVVRSDADTGEGPVWDHRSGRLCWVDIPGGTLYEDDLRTGDQRCTSLGTMLGAAVPRARSEGFAVAVADGFGLVVDGHLEMVDAVLPEAYRRMNDAKCDSSGRLWAGSTHLEFVPGHGALHRWAGGAGSSVAASGFVLPNGLGWTADDRVMYLVDSMTRQLMSAPFRAEDGVVGEFTPLCEIDGGLPDGLAVDADGCVWLAVWGGGEVRRYRDDGVLIGRVPLPVDQPSSCAFGDDGTLYITSASAGLDGAARRRQTLAGSVFALSTTTRGVPVGAFQG